MYVSALPSQEKETEVPRFIVDEWLNKGNNYSKKQLKYFSKYGILILHLMLDKLRVDGDYLRLSV